MTGPFVKIFILTILVCACGDLFSQAASAENLYGDWLCKEVVVSSSDKLDGKEKQAAEIVKKCMTDAVFSFHADGIFFVRWSANAPEDVSEMDFINNRNCSFNVGSQMISIGTQSLNLMKICVRKTDEVLTFRILETPLPLRMERM